MQRTVAFADDEQRPFDREDMPAGPQQQDVVRLLHWKPGAEVPPFLSSNTAVVALLSGLVDGTVHEVPSIIVSEAIAVQIYLLVFDEQLCAEVLKDIGYSGLYIILGSLALRRRIEPPDDKARKRLQSEMERKSTPSNRRAPGLVLAFREKVKKRERDLEMVGMTADAARDHLLLRWDANPFSFNWGEQLMAVDEAAATTSGGGGGDDGPAAAATIDAAPRASMADLDFRTHLIAAGSECKSVALQLDSSPRAQLL